MAGPGSRGLDLSRFEAALPAMAPVKARGRVVQVVGMTAEAEGVTAPTGEICHIYRKGAGRRAVEAVGFRNGRLLLAPLDSLAGGGSGECGGGERADVHGAGG